MSELIVSVSGLRGVVGATLTPEIVIRYVGAFAEELPPGCVILTRDGRNTGPMLADAARSTLVGLGREVLDAGVAATPTLGILVRARRAAGGVQISASHNPAEYNGIKLFSAQGQVIAPAAGEAVLRRFRSGAMAWKPHDALGAVSPIEDAHQEHLRAVVGVVDAAAIRKCKFRVLLDANHGSGSLLGDRLLRELGCEVVLLGGTPDGRFAHPPEPTEQNLQSVRTRVVREGAAIGFCQDPDADRLAVIDAAGRYLGEEYTLAICVEHRLRQQLGPIVINCSTSRMAADIAARHGAPLHLAKVGEANVVEQMRACGAVLGGEGNGGVIDPRIGYVRDSFAGMALLLEAMAQRGLPIGALADDLPRYAIVKRTVELARERLPAALGALEAHYPDARASRLDGLRLDWPDKWLGIRGSGTEPIVRVFAEAATREAAERLCDEAAAVLAQSQKD